MPRPEAKVGYCHSPLPPSVARSRSSPTAGSCGSPYSSPQGSSPILLCPPSPAPPLRLCCAIGICLALRSAPLGLALAGGFLAFASGFATAKLRTEITRAPVLAHELRYVGVSGWVEAHELRDKGRARLTIRVLSLGDLEPEERPYRVRVTMPAPDAAK
jgi:hypothetical protein